MLRQFAAAALCSYALCTAILAAPDAKKPVTIDALMKAQKRPSDSVTWAPDGKQFVSQNEGKLLLYNVKSGKTRDFVDLSKLTEAAEKTEPSPVTDWTNRRVSEDSIEWFPNGKHLLVAEAGDLFIVDPNKGSFDQLTHTPQVERDPKLSPDGLHVSFRRGSDLFVLDIATKDVRAVTHDGSATLLNAQLDWVYPEELDLGTAHWWSPDSHSIAYLQFDISHEPVFPQVSLLNPRGLLEPERYPKAGDPNADVRLGVVSETGGDTRWMSLGDPRDTLLARVAWLPNSRSLTAVKLNRIQNKLDLYIADRETGAARVLLHEESPTWINLPADVQPIFLGNGERFLWTSERDGFRHLYLYSASGQLQKQLTSGNWTVTSIAGTTDNQIFFTSTEASPLERQLYSINLDGSNKQRLTKAAGTHSVSLSPGGDYFLDTFSSLTQVPRTTLCRANGEEIRVYREPDETESHDYNILPTEITKVKGADGAELYARLIKPAGFTPGRKYPAIVMVYGGPGAQTVRNLWSGLSMDQVLATNGFVIWQVDNRGSANRGHAFEAPIYHHLGAQELADQKAGIEQLVKLGFVDAQRIGMFGWSYGGFMTLYTITNAPGLIKAAVAGAPVTSWRNYDTIYTERYMGLPDDNIEGYKAGSPQTKASDLQSKLLIIHNIEDDNVHFANTMQMADLLEKANRPFTMLTYPQKTHGVTGPLRRHMYQALLSFFEQNLKGTSNE